MNTNRIKVSSISLLLLATLVVVNCGRKVPDSAQGAAEQAVEALKSGKLGDLYALLPPSYKKDVQSLAQGYAKAFEEETYENFAGVPGNLLVGLEKSKKQLEKDPMMKRMLGKTDIDGGLAGLKELWGVLESGGVVSHKKMTSLDVQAFLDDNGQDLMKAVQQLTKSQKKSDLKSFMKKVDKTTISVSKEGAEKTVLAIKVGKKTTKATFVKVEGHWIPVALKKQWKKKMKRERKSLKKFAAAAKKNKKKYKKMSASLKKTAKKFAEKGDLAKAMQAAFKYMR